MMYVCTLLKSIFAIFLEYTLTEYATLNYTVTSQNNIYIWHLVSTFLVIAKLINGIVKWYKTEPGAIRINHYIALIKKSDIDIN